MMYVDEPTHLNEATFPGTARSFHQDRESRGAQPRSVQVWP